MLEKRHNYICTFIFEIGVIVYIKKKEVNTNRYISGKEQIVAIERCLIPFEV